MLEGSEGYNASESTGDIILETNNTDMEVHDLARTVICILCNGTIDYKNEDSTTFRKHMKDQHGAFHHIDYILASCFLSQVEIENIARRPLKELEAQEFSKVEELQETLAEDSGPGQHGRGKRVAEDLQAGMPVKKRMKKAVTKMELEVESSQEESIDGVALEEGNGEAAGNEEVADFDDSLDLGHQEQVEGLEQKNHSSKGVKMFSCHLCEKKFTTEKGSRSHMTRIHGTAPRSGRRGKNINTESIVNQSHPTETVAEEGVEGGLNLEATESEDMFNSENQNSEDQSGFEQGNFGETSSLEMEDSMADDSADLELESKEMDDLTIEGAAITEDVNEIEKYQDVPAESDTSMDIADVAAMDQESNGRLMCSFGCGKSYGTKGSLANHEIKVHNRPKLKSRKSQKPTVEMKLEESGLDGTEATAEMGSSGELVSQTEEADTPGVSEQMLGGSTMQSGSLGDFDFEIQESEAGGNSVDEKDAGVEDGHVEATIDVGLTCSEGGEKMMHDEEVAAQDEERTNREEGITGDDKENTHQKDEMAVEREEATEQGGEATTQREETSDQGEDKYGGKQLGDGDFPMTSEDQEKQDEDKQFGENVPEKQIGSLDIKGSEYFTKYPKAIANPQEKTLKLFKNAEGLPEGWKVRLLKDPKDDGKIVRHYLSPDTRVLKTGQGVVEYLRLAGTLSKDQILEIAKNVLLLSEKKISALFH